MAVGGASTPSVVGPPDDGTPARRRGAVADESFRLSFLVAYAGRIGERFAATSSSVTDALQRDDQRLLPVLAARNSAADLAMLDVRDSIAG